MVARKGPGAILSLGGKGRLGFKILVEDGVRVDEGCLYFGMREGVLFVCGGCVRDSAAFDYNFDLRFTYGLMSAMIDTKL